MTATPKPKTGSDTTAQQPSIDSPAPEVQLNLNVRGLPPSATVAINERSDGLRRQGRRIFKMGLGQSPFPVPESVVQELQRNAFQKDYLPVKGLPELRQAVAEHHHRTLGITCAPEDVLIGPGSKELMFLLQLVYYGDLLVPTPTWVSYAPQAQIIGRKVQFLPTCAADGWRLTAAKLDEVCQVDPGRPRIVVLNYPANPTAVTYSSTELAELADVARRYRVVVLSDEIYGKLHHEGGHTSIVPHYPQGTLFSGGLSKWCGAGGWRLGVFVFPAHLRWLLDSMAAVASETFTATSAPIQYAAVRAFQEGPDIDEYLRSSRRILRALGCRLVELLRRASVDVVDPQGGFYLFPDFTSRGAELASRGIKTSVQLCERLLDETGVAILPGREFGRPATELTARLAYVNFDGGSALRAAGLVPEDQDLDESFLRTQCGEALEAVELICQWLEA